MKNSHDMVAWLLAAEEHPHLREEAEYLQAEIEVLASPELKRFFEESRSFLERHPVLTSLEGMPQDCRERIRETLESGRVPKPEGKAIQMNPWGVRKQFAWAAVLALLLAGMSFFSSHVVQRDRENRQLASWRSLPPAESFYQFAGQLAGGGRMPLQHRGNGSTQLVSWLEERGAQPFQAPENLLATDTMGCALLEGPHGKVSLICFDTEQGTVHLFVTTTDSVELQGESAPTPDVVNGRQALKWHDQENAYLLMTHDPDQALPEVFL